MTRQKYLEAQDGDSATDSPKTSRSDRLIDPEAFKLMESLREIVVQDRALTDKGAKAFVSTIRAYSKHEASYIFRLKSLHMFGMGVAYGLLRLPRMPEVKEWKEKERKEVEREAKDASDAQQAEDRFQWQDREIDVSGF